jgi:hypothetical protein
LLFINGDKLFFLFRHRLGRGWLGGGKEFNKFIPKSSNFFANGDDFISGFLDLNKLSLGFAVQIAPSLYLLNQPSGK